VVLCREAGFEGGTAAVGNPLSGAGLGYRPAGAAPALAGMRCNGTEEALAECVYRTVPPLPPTPYFDYVQREGSLSLFTGPSLPLLLCPDAFNESDAAAGAAAAFLAQKWGTEGDLQCITTQDCEAGWPHAQRLAVRCRCRCRC
jgi:hypothetical protein